MEACVEEIACAEENLLNALDASNTVPIHSHIIVLMMNNSADMVVGWDGMKSDTSLI